MCVCVSHTNTHTNTHKPLDSTLHLLTSRFNIHLTWLFQYNARDAQARIFALRSLCHSFANNILTENISDIYSNICPTYTIDIFIYKEYLILNNFEYLLTNYCLYLERIVLQINKCFFSSRMLLNFIQL